MKWALALSVALGAGAAAVVLTQALPGVTRRGRGVPLEAPIVLSALGGLLVHGELTGNLIPDLVLGGGIAALAAWAAARSPHRVVAAIAVTATVLLDFSLWTAAGAGAAIAVVALRTRLPPVKAIAGGLIGVGLLVETGPLGPSWREMIALALVLGLAGAAARRTSAAARRAFGIAVSVALGVLALAAAGFLIMAIPAARELQRGVDLSQGAARVLTSTAGDDASASLALAANAFGKADDRLRQWPARMVDLVPVAAQNAAALRSMAAAGEQVASAAGAATSAPADLRFEGGGVDLAAVDRSAHDVARSRLAVTQAIASLAAVRSRSLVGPVEDARSDLSERLMSAAPTLRTIDRALTELPDLLGGSGPRRYLLALQTPAETRSAGGIIGAFAVLEADQGRIALTRTGNAQDLNSFGDPAARSVDSRADGAVEDFVDRYGRFSPLQIWQNVSMTPDWPTAGRVASQLFPQSGGQPVDGVIGLDPFALAAILAATGPIEVPPWPVPISAENAASILLHEQYLFFPNPERKEFLSDVTAAVFARLTGEGTSLRDLSKALAGAARQRNVQIWSANSEEQDLFADLAVAGAFPRGGDGADLLSVVTQNSSGNKIDWFLHRSTSYDVTFDPDLGRVEARLGLELRNDSPASGLPDYVIGGAGPKETRTNPGENRTWLSVYSPLELEGASIDGRPLDMEAEDELGHHVYSAFVTIPPGGKISIELFLFGPVDPDDSKYRLRVRSQVLPNSERVTVTARFADGWRSVGRTREEFDARGERDLAFEFATRDE